MMGDNEPVNLSSRRKEEERANRVATVQRWAPSRAVMAWTALLSVAAVTHFAFGWGSDVQRADMSATLQPGGIKECGIIRYTCLVDADTGWQDGVKWRLLNIDAPEMDRKAECAAEKEKAEAALQRLRELMADGYTIKNSGRKDRYDRALVDVMLRDGRDAGNVLMAEGLAQPWPNSGNVWCGR